MTRKNREAYFAPEFLEDLRFWVETDRKIVLRLLELVEAVLCDPFTGIGKPEHLKQLTPGTWSRRLTHQDRLIYRVLNERIDVLQGRFHY